MWWLVAWARAADGDLDGVDDSVDACPSVADPTQTAAFGDPTVLPSADRTVLAALAAGDLDGDGDADLLGVAYGGLIGNTLVTWRRDRAGWTVEAGPDATSDELSLADVDGDGDLDALLPNYAQWYRNDGSGGFTLAQSFHATWDDYDPTSEGTAPLDVDGDGDVDVVYVVLQWWFYGGTGYPDVFLGTLVNDGGVFTDAGAFWYVDDVGRLAAGDVDGDGDGDLVRLETFTHALYVHLGDGAGAFTEQPDPVADVRAMAVGDLDGDGDAEVVVAKTTGDAAILEDTPAGWVEHPLALPPADLERLSVGDLDRDGDLDVVATGASTVWWQNTGGLGFADGEIASPAASDAIAIGDVDASGTTDVVVGADTEDAPLLLPNTAPADHDGVPPCDVDDPCPLDPAAVCVDADGDGLSDADEADAGTDALVPDTDGDGASDLAEALGASDPLEPDTDGDLLDDGSDPCPLHVGPDHHGVCGCVVSDPVDDLDLDGIADWCDACPVLADPTQGPGWADAEYLSDSDWFALADLDGDVDLDLVVASANTGLAVLENVDGSFGAPVDLGLGGQAVAAADIDEDGLPDVVLARPNPNVIVWRRNLGGLAFGPEATIGTFASSAYLSMISVDLVGSPAPDVALVGWPEWTTIENLGGGVFAAQVTASPPLSSNFPRIASADTDGDGDLDLLLASGSLYLVENVGGGFGAPTLVPGTDFAGGVAAGDLDGDGDVDLAAPLGVWNRTLTWLENDGGSWIAHPLADVGIGSLAPIAVADVSGDGALDLVVVEDYALIAWYAGDGAGGFTRRPSIQVADVGLWRLAVADIDLDTRPDLVASGWYNVDWFLNVGTPDADGDGVCDPLDPDWALDPDGDGLDAAAEAQAGTDPDDADTDGDGVLDGADDCPRVADPAQADGDGDGLADACDRCPYDAADDSDADGACDSDDACPGSPDYADADGDGVADACDVCPRLPGGDADGDGVCDADDACGGYPDGDDSDGDGAPDACDPCPDDAPDDTDGDGVCDSDDACPGVDDALGCDPPPTSTTTTTTTTTTTPSTTAEPAAPTVAAPSAGCGCRASGAGGGWFAAALAAWLVTSSRTVTRRAQPVTGPRRRQHPCAYL